MYLSDIASETYYPQNSGARHLGGLGGTRDMDSITSGNGGAPARRPSGGYRTSPPAPPTSIPLDDSFDALTTEVPTEWVVGDGHPEYDESVSGYRNYVTEMERMLSGQMENAARVQERQYGHDGGRIRRTTSINFSESARGSSRIGGGRKSAGVQQQQPSLSLPQPQPLPMSPPENARQVSGKRGKIELVEQRVLEDSPARTVSLWRERVAQSSGGGSACADELQSQAGSHTISHVRPPHAHTHTHRRVSPSSVNSDARLRRVVSENPRYVGSVNGSGTRNGSTRDAENAKSGRASYERSEYMVSYQQVTKGGLPKGIFLPSETRELRTPSSQTLSEIYGRSPPSPTLRRHAARKSLERSEFMVTYPQTPPLTNSQTSSSSPKGNNIQNIRSPIRSTFRDAPEDGSTLRVMTTSSVEVILSSCDPSLLHIAPTLYELGIKRVDHLRAIARLSEETRDREVKEQALKRGVTVVEWAIFLDKLQSLLLSCTTIHAVYPRKGRIWGGGGTIVSE